MRHLSVSKIPPISFCVLALYDLICIETLRCVLLALPRAQFPDGTWLNGFMSGADQLLHCILVHQKYIHLQWNAAARLFCVVHTLDLSNMGIKLYA